MLIRLLDHFCKPCGFFLRDSPVFEEGGKEQLTRAAVHLVNQLFCLALGDLVAAHKRLTDKSGFRSLDSPLINTLLDDGISGILVPADAARQDVYVGIRPEGFIVQEDGPFSCTLKGVEVMGRDISVLSYNNASLNPTVRSIIGAQYHVDAGSGAVRFALNPRKVLLFAKDTETRIK